MHPVLPPHDFSLWTESFPKTPHREPTSCSHSVTCWFDHFFLFPRVKSEAIVARREPKEEVEDVSSYLCTELVYYITKMAVGKGGLCTTIFMCDTRDADWSLFVKNEGKAGELQVVAMRLPFPYNLQIADWQRWTADTVTTKCTVCFQQNSFWAMPCSAPSHFTWFSSLLNDSLVFSHRVLW